MGWVSLYSILNVGQLLLIIFVTIVQATEDKQDVCTSLIYSRLSSSVIGHFPLIASISHVIHCMVQGVT